MPILLPKVLDNLTTGILHSSLYPAQRNERRTRKKIKRDIYQSINLSLLPFLAKDPKRVAEANISQAHIPYLYLSYRRSRAAPMALTHARTRSLNIPIKHHRDGTWARTCRKSMSKSVRRRRAQERGRREGRSRCLSGEVVWPWWLGTRHGRLLEHREGRSRLCARGSCLERRHGLVGELLRSRGRGGEAGRSRTSWERLLQRRAE